MDSELQQKWLCGPTAPFVLVAEPHAVRAAIAMTGQFASLDEDLTGRENLILLARLWGFRGRAAKARADNLPAVFDLTDAASKQVKSYSGGMRRRLDIAASLIVTPGVLFLDEPTTGLDPKARQGVWRMIRDMSASGVTILLTTQYMEEADQLAERIAVIDHGHKIAEGTSRELKAAIGSGRLHVREMTDRSNRLSYLYGVMLNRRGRRFLDEGEDTALFTYAKFGRAILAEPGAKAYQIFDSKVIHLLEPRYETSKPITSDTL